MSLGLVTSTSGISTSVSTFSRGSTVPPYPPRDLGGNLALNGKPILVSVQRILAFLAKESDDNKNRIEIKREANVIKDTTYQKLGLEVQEQPFPSKHAYHTRLT
ncbi:hypothetical protein AX774_g46 [Zancudomyces culisetae]|uniref:Uncharacterized protein n=1 Tax=Zancudomyces culisetae TaxID=1213189 RepID=A0A1R1PZI8_ZANCU|nr:hypothetical protein AX774_g46 [Zancudomyces culisetae]|eukprot:OMH86383.1 hypothetical protein AX774_g46 [Zancudomyces culisetae]